MSEQSEAKGGAAILAEVEEDLRRPSRNTKTNILISFNLVIGLSILFMYVSQLAAQGRFNSPYRDWIIFILVPGMNLASALYHIIMLIRKRRADGFWHHFFSIGSYVLNFAIVLSLVHTSKNPPLTILYDAWIGMVMIVVGGLIFNRKIAVLVFCIVIVNILLAVSRIGFGFVYDSSWVFPEPKKIVGLTITLSTYMTIAFLVIFFESGMLGKILKVIPSATQKIRTAAEEQQQLEIENTRLSTELDVARQVQEMVLPSMAEIQQCQGCLVAARMDPATEVGGDYYDVLPMNGKTIIGIGDVTDHGLQSGVVMLMVQAAVRALVEGENLSLIHTLANVNELVYRNVQVRMEDLRNLTLSLCRFQGGKLTICGQHEKVLVLRQGGTLEEIDTVDLGMYIGLMEDIRENLQEAQVDIEPGDRVLFYTDGAVEAENSAGKEFGLERVGESFTKHRSLGLQDTLNAVYEDIYAWIGQATMYDDITMVAMERT